MLKQTKQTSKERLNTFTDFLNKIWENWSVNERARQEDFNLIWNFAKQSKDFDDLQDRIVKYDDDNDTLLYDVFNMYVEMSEEA